MSKIKIIIIKPQIIIINLQVINKLKIIILKQNHENNNQKHKKYNKNIITVFLLLEVKL
jgi:hypothetical protein